MEPGHGAGASSVWIDLRALRAALAERARPMALASKGLLFAVSLALFVALAGDRSPASMAALVGVLLLHELGHFAAMHAFGYRDLRIFFLPLFGAAAMGKKRHAEPWQEGVVSLAGPVPGLVLGLVLAASAPPDAALLRTVAWQLVGINAFNLLPLLPLDGGQLFSLILYSRHYLLELVFQAIAAAGLGTLAFSDRSPVLGLLAWLTLVSIPVRMRLLRAATGLRDASQSWPADVRELDDEALGALAQAAEVPGKPIATAVRAARVEALFERARQRRPSAGASWALAAAWLAGLLVAITAAFMLALSASNAPRVYIDPEGRFTTTFPSEPAHLRLRGEREVVTADGVLGRYSVTFPAVRRSAAVDPAAELDELTRTFLGERGAKKLAERPLPPEPCPGRALDVMEDGVPLSWQLRSCPERWFWLEAPTLGLQKLTEGFFASFFARGGTGLGEARGP